MAFIGVEFSSDNEGEGGLSVVHKLWLTPLKKETFWPRHIKQQHLFDKCLKKGEEPDDQWQLYKIKRIYFETDDVIKANTKIKKLQFTSDVGSEIEDSQITLKRKRQYPKRLQSSSEEEQENNCLQTKKSSTILPRPPPVQPLVQQKIVVSGSGKSLERNFLEKAENSFDDTTHAEVISSPNISQRILFKDNHCGNGDNRTPSTSRQQTGSHCYDDCCFETGDVLTNSTCHNDANTKNLLKLIIYIRRQNEQILKQNEEILKSLKSKQGLESAIYELPKLPVCLPIKSLEDINRMEEHLIDDDNLSTLSLYLSTLGGRDIMTRTNTILRNILSNEVATKYSFLGTRKEKISFSVLRLHRLVIRAVQLASPNTPESNINDNIKIWLKHSPQRLAIQRKRNAT